MQFDFIPWETDVGKEYLPMLPVQLNGFSVGHALVDTGATVSIFPMSLCDLLAIQLDKEKKIMMSHAGGGTFPVFPSAAKVHYCIDHSGFRPIQWKGTVFFSHEPNTLLLGHFECLDQLIVTLDGPKRKLRVESTK